MSMGVNLSLAQPTLGDLYDRYTQVNILSDQTCQRYWLTVRNLAAYISKGGQPPSGISLPSIDVDVLLGFRSWSLQRMRPVSYNTERCHLSALLNFAVRQRWLASNPMREVPRAPVLRLLPKSIPKADMRASLTLLETAYFIDTAGHRRELLAPQWFWLAVMKTFYLTGMRKRQLLGLLWDDINTADMTIRLRAATSKTRREWLVPLPVALLPDLQTLRDRTREVRGESFGACQVFCLPILSPWPERYSNKVLVADTLDNFFQRLRRHLPKDGPRISAHRIRHTTATVLANSVSNLKVVQELLGHSSILTTYGYVHPDLTSMRKAQEAL